VTAMRIRSAFGVFTAILALSLLHAASPDQKPASDQPAAASKSQPREVVLPVTVRDKKGALVTAAKIGDFTLTEDGRPQTIKNLTRETSLPFRLGLVVDTSRSLSGVLEEERKAAGKFVDTMLPETPSAAKDADRDQAFLIHFDREVELLEDLTSSRNKLHRELEDLGPTRREKNDSQGPETVGDDRDSSRSHGGRGGTQLYDAIFLASDEVMKGQVGRKALVVFSDGVDRGSKDTLNDAVDAADRAGLAIYTIYVKGDQERGEPSFPGGGHHGGVGWPGGGGGGGGYPGGGGGYPGGGGKHGGGEKESGVDGRKIMEKIAIRTGGRYFEAKKKDSLDEIYGQIAEELRGQYLLTYTPDMVDNEGGFHKIALKANKDDLSVVTHEGYYAPDQK